MTTDIDALKAERDALKEELYFVYRSRSWRYTRPMRMVFSRIGRLTSTIRAFFSALLSALTWTKVVKGLKLLFRGDVATLKYSIKLITKESSNKVGGAGNLEQIAACPLDPGQPLVSVVIPCFNYGKFVIGAVDSVLSQTLKNIEVIVVDGGSTDVTTIETLKSLQRPRTITMFREGRHLVGDNRNFGISKAKGRYICCLDADDTLDPTYLEKAVFQLETYSYDIISTSINFVGAKEGRCDTLEYPDLEDMVNGNHVLTCAVFRKKLWESSGGYFDVGVGKNHVAEDWDFWLRLAAKGARIRNISKEYLFNYRVHAEGSLSSGADVKNLSDQKEAIVDRNRDLLTPSAFQNSAQQQSRYLRCNPDESAIATSYDENKSPFEKILILSIPFTLVGGAERLLSGLCSYLANNNWRIIVVTTLENNTSSGNTIDWFKACSQEVYELTKFLDKKEYKDFIRYLIASRKPDYILNAGSHLLYEMLPEIKKVYGNICVVDLLFNTEGHVKSHLEYREYISSTFAESTEVFNWLMHTAGWPPNQIKKIASGVDLFKFQPKSRPKFLVDKYDINENDLVVGFSGRLSEEKGPEFFVEIANLCQGTSNLRFVMTGSGPMSMVLKKQIELLPTPIKFEFAGLVDEVEPYLALYDILILPSRVDGRPQVVMEALACGVPVIASNVGALPDLIEDGRNGYLVPIGNVRAFAARVRELSADRLLLQKLKTGARRTAEKNLNAKKAYSEYDVALRELIKDNESVNTQDI